MRLRMVWKRCEKRCDPVMGVVATEVLVAQGVAEVLVLLNKTF